MTDERKAAERKRLQNKRALSLIDEYRELVMVLYRTADAEEALNAAQLLAMIETEMLTRMK